MRTDPAAESRQEGISFLLIDMRTPGITVRPLILMDGGHEVNEVFFDEVAVPIENRVHEEGKGWTVAKYLLGYERMNTAPHRHVQARAGATEIVRRARSARTASRSPRIRGSATGSRDSRSS